MANSSVNIDTSIVGLLNTGEHSNINIGNINITASAYSLDVTAMKIDFHEQKLIESFKGRDAELEQLTTWFCSGVNMAVISGLPGYGKTELARQFVRQYKASGSVHSVLWMDAETRDSLEQSFRDLLRWLGSREQADLDIGSVVQAVHRHFRDIPHMFVLDNALDRQSVRDYEPQGTWRCLVTSHVADWGDDVPSLPLQQLSPHAAVDVLRAELHNHFNENDLELYGHLVEVQSYVPLALQVTAAYVRQDIRDLQQNFSLSNYVRELQNSYERHIHKSAPTFSKNSYKISIYESIKKSLNKIENINNENSCLALKILYICAYCNPSQICFSFLEKLALFEVQENTLFKSLSVLKNYSFIRIDHDRKQLSMHGLIQETLILYQSDLLHSNHNPYYFACLKFLSQTYPSTHSHHILKHVPNHLNTFHYFYLKLKHEIFVGNIFLNNLIANGCQLILKIILDELGSYATEMINARYLLHGVVLCRQHDLLEMFLGRGAHVDQEDVLSFTPLMVAAWQLDQRSIQILASHGADVNASNSVLSVIIRASRQPQNIARSAEALDAFQWLVGRGARTNVMTPNNETLLHTACSVLSVEFIRCLVLEYHFDVNELDKQNLTPLYYVSHELVADRGRRLRAAELLLELGARTDIVDTYNKTPAEYARYFGIEYLALYLENPAAGYDVEETSQGVDALRAAAATGDTASLSRLLDELGARAVDTAVKAFLLHVAVEHRQHDILELLLTRAIPVDCRDESNNTALYLAVVSLDLRAVQTLVSHGADVNDTVLCDLVASAGYARHADQPGEVCEVLRWLVGRGARTDLVAPGGASLLHLAAVALSPDLVRCLVTECGVDVDPVDEVGRTPLFAVSLGLTHFRADEARGVRMAACLLDLGARLDVLDAQGFTPAEDARTTGHEQLAAFLDNFAAGQVRTSVAVALVCVDLRAVLQETWWQRLRDLCSCRSSQYVPAPTNDI